MAYTLLVNGACRCGDEFEKDGKGCPPWRVFRPEDLRDDTGGEGVGEAEDEAEDEGVRLRLDSGCRGGGGEVCRPKP